MSAGLQTCRCESGSTGELPRSTPCVRAAGRRARPRRAARVEKGRCPRPAVGRMLALADGRARGAGGRSPHRRLRRRRRTCAARRWCSCLARPARRHGRHRRRVVVVRPGRSRDGRGGGRADDRRGQRVGGVGARGVAHVSDNARSRNACRRPGHFPGGGVRPAGPMPRACRPSRPRRRRGRCCAGARPSRRRPGARRRVAAQLPGQLGALREAGRAERVALRDQPAGRVDDPASPP